MQIALFEPDIPQNTGGLIRLSACLGVRLHIIEPCGFPLDDKRLKRVAMDYYPLADITRHVSWQAFYDMTQTQRHRLLLLSVHSAQCYTDFVYRPDDILLLGRESAGVPNTVRASCDAQLKIPLRPNARSLNVTHVASMVLGEALRQTKGFP